MEKFTMVCKETCIACGTCGAVAPEIFDYDDEGIAFVSLDNNKGKIPIPKILEEDLNEAVEGCPTNSIKISTKSFNERLLKSNKNN